MFSENDKISLRQLQMLIILDIFGTSIITLPRLTAEMAGADGWLLIIGAGAIIAIYAFVLNMLSREYPQLTFVELSQKIMTKPIGIVLSIGFAIKLVLTTGLELRVFCEIIRQTMLFTTPIGVTAGVMLLVAAYAAARGYECRARVAEVLVPIVFIPLIFVFVVAAFNTDFTNLQPAFKISGANFAKGSLMTAFSFQGIEFLLLAHPFITKSKNAGKASAQAILVLTALMTATTAITIARFGAEEVKMKLWPVLQMMDTIDIPGSFIERQDVFMMWFWIISAFAGVNAGIFLISLIFSRLSNKRNTRKTLAFLILPVLFVVAMYPNDIAKTYELLNWCNKYLGTTYLFIVPLIVLLVSKLRGKKAEQ